MNILQVLDQAVAALEADGKKAVSWIATVGTGPNGERVVISVNCKRKKKEVTISSAKADYLSMPIVVPGDSAKVESTLIDFIDQVKEALATNPSASGISFMLPSEIRFEAPVNGWVNAPTGKWKPA